MGSSCDVYLPPATRVEDVAEVIGILAGNKPRKDSIGNDGWAVMVPSVRVTVTSIPTMVEITFQDSQRENRIATYHFEAGDNGERLLSTGSTPWWCAVAKRLIDFFGGTVTYNDCGSTENDYTQPTRPDIHATDDAPWQAFQQRIFDVTPLTKKEIKVMEKIAGHK